MAWGKKLAVALNKGFFDTLPSLDEVSPADADIAWFIYELSLSSNNTYELVRHKVVYTKFKESLDRISHPEVGDVNCFLDYLQHKMDEKLENANPPDNHTINEIL